MVHYSEYSMMYKILLIICIAINEIHLVSRTNRNEGYYIIRNYTLKRIRYIIRLAKSKKLRQDRYATCIRKIRNARRMLMLIRRENSHFDDGK
jgi:hypothetical protein